MLKHLWILFIISTTAIFGRTQGPIDGFMKGKGNADIAIGMGINRSSSYTGATDSIYDLSYGAEQLSFFGQYGFTDKLDAVLSVPFVFGASENKLQDLGLHLKYRPLHKTWNNHEWSTLISGGISFPASNYEADVSGALGRREKKLPFRLISQFKTSNGFFINFTGAYFVRFDKVSEEQLSEYQQIVPSFDPQQPSDNYSLMLRFGWAGAHNFFEAFAEYQNTIDGIDFKRGISQPIQLYEVDFLKIGGTYYYGGKDNGVAANFAFIPGLRRNIGNIIFAGVSFILKYRPE
tara:strand:- start:7995 stop:8867 length:873 start_codon:yes stop_codon:yes gene_type:complete